MALTHEQKEKILNGYKQRLARSQAVIWARYKGLTVAQVSDLRRQLRAVGVEGVVVKNSLMRIALEQAGMATDHATMSGPCLVTFVYNDVAVGAKAVLDYARLNEAVFQVSGAVAGRTLMNAEQVRALTMLPSREVLLAQVLGGIQAPISSFVGVLAQLVRGVVNVVDARRKQLEGAAS